MIASGEMEMGESISVRGEKVLASGAGTLNQGFTCDRGFTSISISRDSQVELN